MSNEAITASRYGLDKTGAIGGVPKDFSQAHHRIVNTMVEVNEGIALPESIPQLLPGDDLPGSLQEHSQNLERLFGKLDAKAAFAKFGTLEIHLEDAKPNDSCRSSRSSHFPNKPGGV